VRVSAFIGPALVLGLGLACTVDEVVGSSLTTGDAGSDAGLDAGTPVCPGTDEFSCNNPVCGAQFCDTGCTALSDCTVNCPEDAGASCSFSCERNGPMCAPACTAGACQLNCAGNGERLDCSMTCNPLQSCAVDCRRGQCTVACGDSLPPATVCDRDAGVYSCSGTCPP